jgi:serine/threonine protein kinase
MRCLPSRTPLQAALLGGSEAVGSSRRAMALLSDVASGLAALHERSIVHRDLKPHNVLITDSGHAKLSDMGLSKQLVAEQSSFESHGAGGGPGAGLRRSWRDVCSWRVQ